jgi:hypothetical protein
VFIVCKPVNGLLSTAQINAWDEVCCVRTSTPPTDAAQTMWLSRRLLPSWVYMYVGAISILEKRYGTSLTGAEA